MLFSHPVTEHFAAFEAQQSPLDDIRAFVQAALLETPLEKKVIAGLMLAVEEAVTNIIRHGYLFGPGRIHVRVRREARWTSIVLTDTGRSFSLDTESAPDLQHLAETGRRGGLGLYLMRKVTDRVDYRPAQGPGDENVLTLLKRYRPAPSPSLSHSSLRHRLIWVGMLAVAMVVAAGTGLILRQSAARMATEFFEQWTQFGRTAAAATTQHILNDRSDAEFDQLVMGLKSAHRGIAYLVILSESPGHDAGPSRIRAHSENPALVHENYESPAGTLAGRDGRWLVRMGDQQVYHFVQSAELDARAVGAVVWGVPASELTGLLSSDRQRILRWSAVILLIGWLLVLATAVWMIRPILKLIEALRASNIGGANPQSAVAGPEEIRQVVTAFNEAKEAVAQTHREMAERDQVRREMEASQQLQRALLPQRLPDLPDFQLGAACRMARQVGGDYYDVFPVDSDRWLIIVADVAGKGLPAALLMVALRTATRLLAPSHPSPTDLLGAIHSYLLSNHTHGPFITACCLLLDVRRHEAQIASAGHTPALLRTGISSTLRHINPQGKPIGLPVTQGEEPHNHLDVMMVTFQVGDQLLLYTDGVTEARSGMRESYGLPRLEAAVMKASKETPQAMVDELLRDLDQYTASSTVTDDLTLFAIQCKVSVEIGTGPSSCKSAGTIDIVDPGDAVKIGTSEVVAVHSS